jgi:hypothetical protein
MDFLREDLRQTLALSRLAREEAQALRRRHQTARASMRWMIVEAKRMRSEITQSSPRALPAPAANRAPAECTPAH